MMEAEESEAKLVVGTLEPRLENTHFSLLDLFPLSPHLSAISTSISIPPSRSCFSPHLLVIFPSASFFPAALCFDISHRSLSLSFFFDLIHDVVSLSFTSADPLSYSLAVSSLFSFHLPLLTLVPSLLGFISLCLYCI